MRVDNRITTQELRFRATAWENEIQEVKVVFGFGYFTNQFTNTTQGATGSQSGIAADLGIDYVFLKSKSGPVKGQLAIDAIYRFARPNAVVNPPFFSKPVTSYNGVIFGLAAGLYF